MKATIGTVVLTLLPLAAAAQKTPSHHPSAAESTTPDTAKLQDLMRRMRAQMDALRTTTDPGERQKLLAEHGKLLQEHMRLLRGAEPAPAGAGMAGHEDGGMPGVAPRSRARMVEDRIDMLAMAMEQMEAQIMELSRDLAAKKP